MCTPCQLNLRDTQKRVPVAQTLVSFTSVSRATQWSLSGTMVKRWHCAFRVVIGEFLLSFSVFEHIRQCNYTFRYAGIVLVCTFNVSGMVISVLEVYHVL